jgi:integrase
VSWVGFHTFRHTCAFLLFAEGRNAVQVKRWLGHH